MCVCGSVYVYVCDCRSVWVQAIVYVCMFVYVFTGVSQLEAEQYIAWPRLSADI